MQTPWLEYPSWIQINVRKNERANQEWTIQRHWQHWVHRTQDKDKHNTASYDGQPEPHEHRE